MGYYEPTGSLEFEGTNSENQMMEKLLQIMDVLDPDAEYELPADFEDYAFPLALLGVLYDYDPENGSYKTPSLELELAPKLFASLFPNANFHYVFTPWYSVTNDDTETITAIYKEKELMVRLSYYDSKRAESLCRKLIKQDEDALEKYEEYLEGEDLTEEDVKDDPDVIDWFDVLGELTENDGKDVVDESYAFYKQKPSRNKKYESSFFVEGDLQAYLVREQIKNHDMSLAEYIQHFAFTEEQFQEFIQVAAESGFSEMTAFLLEEKQNRVAEAELSDDGSHVLKPIKKEGDTDKTEADETEEQSGFEFKDKIFVLTGFGELTFELAPFIEARGGIVKSSTVLKTDYLIFDEKDGINTVKYRRAIELNAKGKNIQMIPGKKFFEMVDFK